MIINSSRAQEFIKCRRSCFNHYHRGLEGARSMALTDGGAVHEGIAAGLATKDWGVARTTARANFEKSTQGSTILPEEASLLEDHWATIEEMLKVFQGSLSDESYEVIQPECQFDVELPGTGHHCIFLHWYSRGDDLNGAPRSGPPDPLSILNKLVIPCTCTDCWVSHRLVGKTDAIVAWRNNIWLLEHKTTSILGAQFWDQFLLDLQPTTYLYGIWKSLAVRPSGVVVNALFKPSEAQVSSWNRKRKVGALQAKDYIKFEREAFLRTVEDLTRVEEQYIDIANEWEERIISGRWPLSNVRTVCMSYNRLCDYHAMCLSHDGDAEIEVLATRAPDYVNEKLVQLKAERKGI